MLTLAIVAAYFAALLAISRLTARGADNATFYRANGRAPWYMVAFGMVGASISGVTFVSVPGMVLTSQMTYLQVCLGFIAGYAAVAFVLLPLYYRLGLTSIYAYLGQRLGRRSYATGAWFFLLSKLTGSALKFYVVCMILQDFVLERAGVPFAVTAAAMVMLIWLYTRRGGIATLVFTDSFQTLCLLAALVLIIAAVVADLGLTPAGAVAAVAHSDMSRIFVFGDWASPHHFLKQFVSGAFIVVVMTGLDQDMMQKNLTCRTLADAQKDMCTYGVAFVPVNMLFLALGVLLTMAVGSGVAGDALLTTYVRGSQAASLFFVLGIVAASFSSADSALTSLTTSYCIDLRRRPDDERLRKRVHAAMCVAFVACIIAFRQVGSTSLIDAIYTLVGYTYGPLLGLFAFGLFTRRQPADRLVPYVCVASPLLCYALSVAADRLWGYRFGYEMLMLNGALTFFGLWASVVARRLPQPQRQA